MLYCEEPGCKEQAERGGYCKDHQNAHLAKIAKEIRQRAARDGHKVVSVNKLHPAPTMDSPRKKPSSAVTKQVQSKPSKVTIARKEKTVPEQKQKAKPEQTPKPAPKKSKPQCTLEFCPRKPKKTNANGLCPWHRFHQLIGLELKEIPDYIPYHYECDWPGCKKRQASCGFCSPHINWLRTAEKAAETPEALALAIQAKLDGTTISTPPSDCATIGCEFPTVNSGLDLGLCGRCTSMYRIWRDQHIQSTSPSVKFTEKQSRVFEDIYLRVEQKH